MTLAPARTPTAAEQPPSPVDLARSTAVQLDPVRQPAVTPELATPARRGPRPRILTRFPIDEYSSYELNSLPDWISSDGRLRTIDEMVDEVFHELGYGRRGAKLMFRLQQIVNARSQS